jgi:hypothetical protein
MKKIVDTLFAQVRASEAPRSKLQGILAKANKVNNGQRRSSVPNQAGLAPQKGGLRCGFIPVALCQDLFLP